MENVKIPLPQKPTRLLDKFRTFIRLDGKSYSTENTYVYWVHQYILSATKSTHELENQFESHKKNASELKSNPSSEAKIFVESLLNKKL